MPCVVFLLIAGLCGAQSRPPGDLRSLVHDSLRFVENDQLARQVEYQWQSERKQFDSSGRVTNVTTLSGEKATIDGVPVHRVTSRDGKKLTEDEQREHEAELREAAEKAKAEKRTGNGRTDWVKEVGDALDFQLAGEDHVNGRAAWVLTCTPRQGYSPKNMRAKVFQKMNGKMWIDKAERELVRAEAETFDTVNIGLGLLGRVEKGTRFQMVRTRLPEGAWVLESQNIRFGARMMLVKWIGSEIHTRQWNYRFN